MTDEHRSPITGDLHLVRADGEPDGHRSHRLRDLWRRIGHVYRTRVRTTTVLLVVAWIAGLILYMFAANHYGVIPPPPAQQQRPAVTPSVTSSVEPTTSSRTSEPSTSTPPSESETATSGDEQPTTGSESSPGSLIDRLPLPLRPQPTAATGGAVPSA